MSGIEVKLDRILAVRRRDERDLWIQFRPTGAEQDVLEGVERAMEAANAVMDPFDGRTDGYTCCFVGPWQSLVGTRVFHMMEDTGGESEAITDWLEAFTDALETADLHGVVEPLPKQDLSATNVLSAPPYLQMTSFVAYSLHDLSPPRWPERWNVPAHATQRIADHIATSAFDGCETILGGRPRLRTQPAAIPRALPHRLATQSLARATFVQRRPPRFVSWMLTGNGMVSRTIRDPSRDWPDYLQGHIASLVALADITDVGLVEVARGWLGGWSSIGRGANDLPGTDEADFRYQRSLLDRYVPDARGVMLVTDAHLAKANDLTNWTVQALDHGRHLLQAADLAAWYTVPTVDPEVVAKARHDLGAMILTPDDIARHNRA